MRLQHTVVLVLQLILFRFIAVFSQDQARCDLISAKRYRDLGLHCITWSDTDQLLIMLSNKMASFLYYELAKGKVSIDRLNLQGMEPKQIYGSKWPYSSALATLSIVEKLEQIYFFHHTKSIFLFVTDSKLYTGDTANPSEIQTIEEPFPLFTLATQPKGSSKETNYVICRGKFVLTSSKSLL